MLLSTMALLAARAPRALRLAWGAAILALLPACWTACPKPADWLDTGFRSPAQTFHSFQCALAADEYDLGYRALSSGMKAREHVSGLGFREGLSALLRQKPWLRRAASAVVVSEERLGPSRAALVAEVKTLFHRTRFRVELVREEYWELWTDERRAADDLAAFDELVRVSDDGRWLVGAAPLPPDLDPDAISELRVGREWKIDSLVPLDDDDESEPRP